MVCCAGCHTVQMPQHMPPLPPPRPLLPRPPPPPAAASKNSRARKKSKSHATGSNKVQVPCGGCNAVLGVPPGVAKFACPKCGAENAIELEEINEDSLPVVPPGCLSDRVEIIQDFVTEVKGALVSVGIVRDTILGNGEDSRSLCGHIKDLDLQDVGRFLNRLLGLPPDIQNRLFELFVSILDLLIQNARIEGNLDTGIVDMKPNVIELQGTPKTVYIDQVTGASTVLFTFILDRGAMWELANTMLNEKQKDGRGSANGFYESKSDWFGRRHFILAFGSSVSAMYKIVRPAVGESLREMHLAELKSKYRKVSSLENAQKGWEDEYEVSSKQFLLDDV